MTAKRDKFPPDSLHIAPSSAGLYFWKEHALKAITIIKRDDGSLTLAHTGAEGVSDQIDLLHEAIGEVAKIPAIGMIDADEVRRRLARD